LQTNNYYDYHNYLKTNRFFERSFSAKKFSYKKNYELYIFLLETEQFFILLTCRSRYHKGGIMEKKEVSIYGCVKSNGISEGLIGLSVVFLCEMSGVKLAEGLTDKNGRFRIDLAQMPALPTTDRKMEGSITLYDRNGTLIHHSKLCIAPDGSVPTPVVLKVSKDSLRDHMKEPLYWEPCDAGRMIRRVVDTIETALMQAGEENYKKPPSRSLSGLFSELIHFENMVDEAQLVLEGDAQAEIRLREILENLYTPLRNRSGSVVYAFESLVRRKELEKDLDLLKPFVESDHQMSEAISQVAVPLVTAAAYAAEDSEAKLARYVGVVVDQICMFGQAVKLKEIAARTLNGGARDRKHFVHIWEIQRDRPLIEPTHGLPVDDELQFDRLSDTLGLSREEIREIVTTIRIFTEVDCALRNVDWVRRHLKHMTVFEIVPRRACPGETISIKGSGFGNDPGTVYFHEWHGPPYSWIPGELESWNADLIIVKVPPNAGQNLKIEPPWHYTYFVCGRFVSQLGITRFYDHFEGTSPEILFFSVNGETEKSEICVVLNEQGETSIFISWKIAAADEISIAVVPSSNQPTHSCSHTTQELDGTWVCDQLQRGIYWVRLIARGTCQPAEVKRETKIHVNYQPDLHVHGIEITQAIQYYHTEEHMRLLNDGGIRLPTFMNLVCGKEAWVRVYVRSGRDGDGPSSLPGVSGKLWIHRIDFDGRNEVFDLDPWFDANDSPPFDITTELNPDYQLERGDRHNTLNFRIPARKVGGHMELYAFVFSDAWPCEGSGHRPGEAPNLVNLPSSAMRLSISAPSASHGNFLVVRAVMVGYDGPDIDGNHVTESPPTRADLVRDLRLIYAMFPVEAMAMVGFRKPQVHSLITWDRPLMTKSDWQDLKARVRDQLGWFPDSSVVYVGFVSGNIPRDGDIFGIASSGSVAVATQGIPQSLAHEIGHVCGLKHAPASASGSLPENLDPNYPVYETLNEGQPNGNYPQASIGEYGLDIRDGTIYSPENTVDFMSYDAPVWISEYHYGKLLGSARLNSRRFQRTAALTGTLHSIRRRQHHTMISIIGSEDIDKGISICSVARYATFDKIYDGCPTGAVAELLDDDEKVMASGEVFRLEVQVEGESVAPGLGEGGPALIQALIVDVGRGASLRIRRGNKELWRREAPQRKPSFKDLYVEVQDENSIFFKWHASYDKSSNTEVWIAYSADEGVNWYPFAAGLKTNEAKLDTSNLPPGKIQFMALLQDGFSSACVYSDPIQLLPRPPFTSIFSPKDGTSIKTFAGGVQFTGFADSCELEEHDPKAYKWSIDGQEVGTGQELWVKNIAPGKHKAELRFSDKHGTSKAESQFEILAINKQSKG
jgi:hypothetical protein